MSERASLPGGCATPADVRGTLLSALLDAMDYRRDQGDHCHDCGQLAAGFKCDDHVSDDAIARMYETETSAGAGHPLWYVAVCRDCGNGDLPMPFSSAAERGKWCAAHTAGSGHDHWLIIEQPKEIVPLG